MQTSTEQSQCERNGGLCHTISSLCNEIDGTSNVRNRITGFHRDMIMDLPFVTVLLRKKRSGTHRLQLATTELQPKEL
jgi:hypothetical protein